MAATTTGSAIVPDDESTERSVDVATLARIRRICSGWPEVEETTLQDRPLFRVRRRRFAILNGATSPPRPRWQGFGLSLHVLADPVELDALSHDPRFEPSPHHGDRGWLALRLGQGTVDWAEVAELLESGYRRAAGHALVDILDDEGDES
jgi:predicted DNA-binding protein (MmcQ/YjbR family)